MKKLSALIITVLLSVNSFALKCASYTTQELYEKYNYIAYGNITNTSNTNNEKDKIRTGKFTATEIIKKKIGVKSVTVISSEPYYKGQKKTWTPHVFDGSYLVFRGLPQN